MDILTNLLTGGVSFGRNTIGIMAKPYETYRRIVDQGKSWEIVYIGLILVVYFTLATLVKTAAFRPFLLTKQFILLAGGAGGGFILTTVTIWVVARLVGGKGKIGKLAIAWAYTLLPTTLWFLTTSILYILLPPPRTTSTLGMLFSILFLIFSATLFWWKVTLAYLTIRFGMRLDLVRIAVVIILAAPIITIYSVGMYRLGIFKVPFL